ncbi:MAG: 4-(cytidine 5'-diphospho)-2-C-methyl-D-erythritol kinase, partial [Calditrichia bacterium]|nr:4-(cytidine 5'-diphospho)-2-C-methyl-D-erythritol kinase [Calditrichia bacterium]
MIDLYDNIQIEYPVNELEINFHGMYSNGIEAEKSTVYKAWQLLKAKNPALPPMKINIEKNIPHGSGLGGGSSDAAFFTIAVNNELSLSHSNMELAEMLSKIGADIPFFLYGPTSLVEGIGEIVTPV